MNFQDIIFELSNYWAEQGCLIQQPYDNEVGAGTFHPATLLRALGPEPWKAAYPQPSRRPTDGRYGNNPNRLQLEQRLASIEEGADAAAFASGSAASLALFQSLPKRSHVIVTEDAYFGTVMQLEQLGADLGHTFSRVDTSDPQAVRQHLQENTRLLWVETPSNPLIRVADIAAHANIAKECGALLCVDNTVATSILQQPLQMGADFSMHSCSKYISGHTDVIGGAIIAKNDGNVWQKIRNIQAIGGAVPSPFDCWLQLRSLPTLALRVRQQCANALQVAKFLESHKAVESVLYPGLPSHPQAELVSQQMAMGGGLMSFLVVGSEENTLRVAASTRLITQATSLGGVESLIEHRKTVEGERSCSPDNLLRLSVGLENANDLIDDLNRALASFQPGVP